MIWEYLHRKTIRKIPRKQIKLYESGNEDKINDNDSTVESIHDSIKQKELDDLQRENQTLKQMVENRNQEINKPREISEDKIIVLSSALGIDKINERLDELNKNDNYLVQEMSKVVNAINQIGQTISGNQSIPTGETPAIGDPIQKMELLSNLFDKGLALYTTYKQNSNQNSPTAIPGLDPNWLMNEAIEAVKDDFSLGKDLRGAIKNSIKGKAVRGIIKDVINSNSDDVA